MALAPIKPVPTPFCRRVTNKLIEDGNKSDDEDAETLAQLLRLGAVKAVYKGDDQQQQLKEICRAYDNLIEDSTRVQNRLKAICHFTHKLAVKGSINWDSRNFGDEV